MAQESKEIKLYLRLYYEIEHLIAEKPELGYLDAEEFIRDALRRFLLTHQEIHILSADPEQQR